MPVLLRSLTFIPFGPDPTIVESTMSTTIGLEEARAQLKDLISHLGPNDEVVITENSQPITQLVPLQMAQPMFCSSQGMLTIVDDDDEHLEEFKDYLP